MKHLLLIVTAMLLSSACVVHQHPRHAHKAQRCNPNHYWDGERCRHRGKNYGKKAQDDRQRERELDKKRPW